MRNLMCDSPIRLKFPGTNDFKKISSLYSVMRRSPYIAMRNTIHLFFLIYFFSILNSCKPDIAVPVPSAGEADFSKCIAVGDDFLSGYMDGALFKKGQQLSIPALIVRQFPIASSKNFVQPVMPDDNGLGLNLNPWSQDYVTRSVLGYRTDCNGETSLFPLNTIHTTSSAQANLSTVNSAINNFSVPFLKLTDYFNPQTGLPDGNVFYHRFASAPGTSTVYSDSRSANATFFIAWTGMADIFEYARKGGANASITSSAQFNLYLDSLLSSLTTNGAKGIIATIPALESFPFYTLIPSRGLDLDQTLADSLNIATGFIFNYTVGKNGFAIEYPAGSGNYRQMGAGEKILLNIPLDSLKCEKMGVFFGIPNTYSLDSLEVAAIHQAIDDYNSIIIQKATQYNLALADMNQYFKSVASGIMWDGVEINAEFISGGFFSLDGYHPNQKGYALVANEFIKAINTKYHASLPPVNCDECDGILFP